MTARSALYVGSVTHRRLRPRAHYLRYRAFWMLLDLDEIDDLSRRLRLLSRNRFNAASFHDSDHGDGGALPLREQVRNHLAEAGIDLAGGTIKLFCMPRIFGYGFNPLSIYFCYRQQGDLAALLYEVHNTFGERHSYLIPVTAPADAVIEQNCRKAFYVSPFLDMDMTYRFRVGLPGDRISVAINAADRDGAVLAAALAADRRDLTNASLLRVLATHPLLTLKVVGAIHWHAARLILKGARLHRRPSVPRQPVTTVMTHEATSIGGQTVVTLSNPSYQSSDTSPNERSGHGPAQRLLDRFLPPLQAGRLQLSLPNRETVERRGAVPGPETALTLHRWRALWRIVLQGEDGFSGGYIDGDWTTPDLASILELGHCNEAAIEPGTKKWLLSLLRNRLFHALRSNTRRGSRRNIAAHYDLGNDFFGPWLDAGMNYSSALYFGNETLEQAQQRKLDRIAALLDLSGGERVLEIGCGWGALAERLVRQYGAVVHGITLSTEQLAYAKDRLAADIARGRADLRLLDYRDVGGQFDRIASIEMVEAVGERYWTAYFAKLRACLARGGTALIQAITIDEARFAQYRLRPDFIQRRIFPGGMLPTRAIIEREATQAGLRYVFHQSFGLSYARTLSEWRSRFLRAWPTLEALGFDQRFRRLWEYYLVYCEVGFRTGAVDVGFYKLAG